jgi:DNA-binding GntR family transcriptional regulator
MRGVRSLASVSSKSTSELIADQLRERILDGSFRPGEQLHEAQIAIQLEVSRGPLREAMQRLNQEGFVVSHRNRGTFVIELSRSDIIEIFEARKMFELAAAHTVRTSPAGDRAATVARLREIVGRMPEYALSSNWTELAKIDLEFHTALVASTGNARLSRSYQTLAGETRVCLTNLKNAYPVGYALVEEHERIVELLERDDADELQKAIEFHLDSAVDVLIEQMGRPRKALGARGS